MTVDSIGGALARDCNENRSDENLGESAKNGKSFHISRAISDLLRTVSFQNHSSILVVRSSMRVCVMAVLLAAVSSCQGEPYDATDAQEDLAYCSGNPQCFANITFSGGNVRCINEDFLCTAMPDSLCGTLVWTGGPCGEEDKCIEGSCVPSCDEVCPSDPNFGDYCIGTHRVFCPDYGGCYTIIERECPVGQTCSSTSQKCETP